MHDEENLDVQNEGFLEATPKGRTTNYTATKDKFICDAWKKVGLDPVDGIEQPKDAHWRRMKEFFNSRNKSGNEQT
jgi:hypothetical protein